MRTPKNALLVLLACAAVPAGPALASSVADDHGSGKGKDDRTTTTIGTGTTESTTTATTESTTTSTTTTTTPGNADRAAFGVVCNDQSRKDDPADADKKTEFAECVTAMAQVRNAAKQGAAGEDNPRRSAAAARVAARKAAKKACKPLSKKHVKGTKGTPYSRCISAAAKIGKRTT